ncbi:MAG: hypothetical protein DYH17_12550 [Xanthomonadales bacterium PRO6]|nr:hypothetical protein [Xanthomonadales bacterium PRO6]
MRFDRADLPVLAREIDGLCAALGRAPPAQIVHSAEFAIRLHQPAGWFAARKSVLGLGWPLLQVLDADELRAALALAFVGASVRPGVLTGGDDVRLGARLGVPLLARTLTRLALAAELARSDWLAGLSERARRHPEPPVRALGELRRCLEARGRGGWRPLLDILPADARLAALGGATLAGGSHRSAAAAFYWAGLAERIWTALEAPFDALLAPLWAQCHAAHAPARERARSLEKRRREGALTVEESAELALLVETIAGARAAHPLWREAWARARRPQVALGLARTLHALDPLRARSALERLAASQPEVSADARALLARLPVTFVRLPETA